MYVYCYILMVWFGRVKKGNYCNFTSALGGVMRQGFWGAM